MAEAIGRKVEGLGRTAQAVEDGYSPTPKRFWRAAYEAQGMGVAPRMEGVD